LIYCIKNFFGQGNDNFIFSDKNDDVVFFPELSNIEQPLSGEVCARTQVWKNLLEKNPPDGWGIDISC
jgi:hypothetical protein